MKPLVGFAALGAAAMMLAGALTFAPPVNADARDAQIERGKYLVTIASCTDCHTPGHFLGKPDMARFLSGSEVGFEIPGVRPNETPTGFVMKIVPPASTTALAN
jgi:mono/diheme cytochrome c family protein